MEIGFIGTGVMGKPMVRCLLDAGYKVSVFDVRPESATELCQLGATWVGSPKEAAQACDVLFTSLPGPAEVEEVMLNSISGALPYMRRGACYIDTTTNSPPISKKIAHACNQQRVVMLDAPVSGRPPSMTMMVGGELEDFVDYKKLFDCMGKNVFHVGPVGSGCAAKLVTQYLAYCGFVVATEGLLIGAKAGLDLGTLAEIVPVSAGASRVFEAFPRSVFGGDFNASGTLDIVAKDVGLACELAQEVGAKSEMGEFAENIFRQAQREGLGSLGYPAVVQILEQVVGTKLRWSE